MSEGPLLIDHTVADILVLTDDTPSASYERPRVTIKIDAYTREILEVDFSFEKD